jgi:geranylgeranyl diphosphate synthase type I
MPLDQVVPGGDVGPVLVADPVDRAWLDSWRAGVRQQVIDTLVRFVRDRCAEHVRDVLGARFVTDLLSGFVTGGKCVRSLFTYLGWLCGAAEGPVGLRVAASTELLHVFALLQDDVMDGASLRRGQPAVHVRLAAWHREQGLAGSADRFGESAAVLLGDLCLVWAEQLLRDSGVGAESLARGWPRYDVLRGELAVGQFADLINDARRHPSLDEVLDVARRKSGNYTVRRPLELGAALAGCDDHVLAMLGGYGELVGEAYQLRDDLLGVFGRPSITGKPSDDLADGKATSVVVLAEQLATPAQHARLTDLAECDRLSDVDIGEWRRLIEVTGARAAVEEMINSRVAAACARLADGELPGFVTAALRDTALRCTDRTR